jgi:hypothetical protein
MRTLLLDLLEWVFTATLHRRNTSLRIYCGAAATFGYVRSFYGLVDLLSILPTWLWRCSGPARSRWS